MRHIILAALPLISTPAIAQEVLSLAQLNGVIAPVRDFKPKDRFDAPPAQPSLEGKRFSYTVAPLERGLTNRICTAFPSWGYWPEKPKFEVDAGSSPLRSYALLDGVRPLFPEPSDYVNAPFLILNSFSCSMTVTKTSATNAFNAQFEVENRVESVNAIAEQGPVMRPWPDYWSRGVAGDAARELAQNMRVRVSGSLNDWEPGTAVKCGTKLSEATMTSPTMRLAKICMVKGKVDKIEFVNSLTGEILASLDPSVPIPR